MSKDKEYERVFIVCPACGYLIDIRYVMSRRSDGSKKCKNCGKQVGWSTYANCVFHT